MSRTKNSIVRQRILGLLFHLGSSYGYNIYKNYIKVFGETTMRNIYYHIKSLLRDKLINIKELKKIEGEFTWGSVSERVYYENSNNNFKLSQEETEKIKTLLKNTP